MAFYLTTLVAKRPVIFCECSIICWCVTFRGFAPSPPATFCYNRGVLSCRVAWCQRSGRRRGRDQLCREKGVRRGSTQEHRFSGYLLGFRFLLSNFMIATELCFRTRCNYTTQNLDQLQFCERYNNANGGEVREFHVEAFICGGVRELLPPPRTTCTSNWSRSCVSSTWDCQFTYSLCCLYIHTNGNGGGGGIDGGQSVGAQFKNQLNSLLGAIGETHPHYVRCLKPNDENVRSNFNVGRIASQLANGGD